MHPQEAYIVRTSSGAYVSQDGRGMFLSTVLDEAYTFPLYGDAELCAKTCSGEVWRVQFQLNLIRMMYP